MRIGMFKYATMISVSSALLGAGMVEGATLYSFSTTKASGNGYFPAFVTVASVPYVNGPTASELPDGAMGLIAFENSRAAVFSLIGNGSTTVDFDTAYFEFTVSADPGYTLDLESLDFDSIRGNTSGTRGFELFAAVNGAAFNQATDSLLVVENEPGTRSAPTLQSVELTDAKFQGISTITFRYYPLTSSDNLTIEFNHMSLSGEVVPEPASLGLLGLGGLALLRRRRGG